MKILQRMGVALLFMVVLLAPSVSYASTLTAAQVTALVGLLRAFEVEQSIIDKVELQLTSTTTLMTLAPVTFRILPEGLSSVTIPVMNDSQSQSVNIAMEDKAFPISLKLIDHGPNNLSDIVGANCTQVTFAIIVTYSDGTVHEGDKVTFIQPETGEEITHTTGPDGRAYFRYFPQQVSASQQAIFKSGELLLSIDLKISENKFLNYSSEDLARFKAGSGNMPEFVGGKCKISVI